MIGIMPASKENIVDKLRNKDHVNIFIHMLNFISSNSPELSFIFGETLNVSLFNSHIWTLFDFTLQVTIAVGGVREVCLGTQVDADVLYIKRR